MDIAGHRQRALLAALAVSGRPVSVSSLVDAVWDEEPPERARATLQTYVSRLRRLLGRDTIHHGPAGYSLASQVTTDLATVRSLVDELSTVGDPGRRGALAEQAMRCWEGPTLVEFADEEWFRPIAVELEETRHNLVEVAAEAWIDAGQAQRAVALLEPQVVAAPLREPTQVQLVRALHASGRVTDALRAADDYRRRLREETGLRPGAGLTEAERQALEGDAQPAQLRSEAAALHRSSDPLPRHSSLVGRAAELSELAELIRSCTLVTVTGTGGIGKTRVVAELLANAPGGEDWFVVDLSALDATADVAATVGAALGQRGERTDDGAVAELLRSESMVLVLDNCEHVAGSVRGLVREVLRSCPHVHVLTTSRVRLGLPEEHLFHLAALSVAGPRAASVQLFEDRLRRARVDGARDEREQPAIVEVCARLEGVPLALELAASRAAVLGVPALAERLAGDLQVVGGGGDEHRHATLDEVVAWSHDLLDPAAQRVLIAVSVFQGDFDVDAAEAVAGGVVDEPVALLLAGLVDASLVDTRGPGRYRLLEMVRSFCRRQPAASGIDDEIRAAHAEWVRGKLERVVADAASPRETAATAALGALRPEIVAALQWCATHERPSAVAGIVGALAGAMLYRPDPILVDALWEFHRTSDPGSLASSSVLAAAARAAFLAGHLDEVDALVERALEGDPDPRVRSHAAHAAGVVRLYQGRFEECGAWFEMASMQDAGVDARLDALGGLALAAAYTGDLGRAERTAAEHRALADAIDSDTYRSFSEFVSGEIDLARGDVDEAVTHLADASDRAWDVGASFVWGIASTALVGAVVHHRPHDEVREKLPVLLDRWRRTATWPQLWTTLRLVAELLAETDPAVALVILEAADRDPAAPTLAGDDRERVARVRQGLAAALGEPVVAGVTAGVAALDRVEVFERARAALAAGLR